jgi:hypothetical protein
MNKTQLARRRKEQIRATVFCAICFALIWAAEHYGWIENPNPF